MTSLLQDLLQDIRYGVRTLAKNPAFALVAVLTLALGIGANTAIFTVVNGILLRPLAFKDSAKLVLLQESLPPIISQLIPVSAPDVIDFRKQNQVFEDLGAVQNAPFSLSGSGLPEHVRAARVSAQMFPILGISPLIGGAFTEEQDRAGEHVLVLSYGLWQRRFGSDPQIVGRAVMLDRQVFTVVGVMPPAFKFPPQGTPGLEGPADLWIPISFSKQELESRADNFNYSVVARLKPGVTLAEADANAKVVARNIQKQSYPATAARLELNATVTPLHEKIVGGSRTLLLLLLGSVGFLLLIACANVANLLLSRAAGRQREMAIRLALGAGRLRLIRQLLVESILLSLAGGILGIILAVWCTNLLIAAAPPGLPLASDISVDARVLGFALLLSVATGVLFGLAPAFAATRSDVNETLKEGMRGSTTGGGHARMRGAFVVSQVAMALVLVTGAGLLIRSFVRLSESNPGFTPIHVLTAEVTVPAAQYNSEQVNAFFDNVLAKTSDLPGVQAVGAASDLPLEGGWTKLLNTEDRVKAGTANTPPSSHTIMIGNYLQVVGIPLKHGRYFTRQEEQGNANVLIVSEGLAQRDFPNEDPLGKRLKWGAPDSDSPWMTIVGVVGDVKQDAPDVATRPHTYEPFLQACRPYPCNSLNLAVRAQMDPAQLTAAVRNVVRSVDSEQPIAHVRTMEQVMDESLAPRRFNLFLLTAFAVAALLLAAIGIYGVLASVVAQQTHEIGIRLALGAQRRDILNLVVGHGLKLAVLGLVIGLAGALGLTRLMTTLLYDVAPTDPVTYGAVAALLGAVALLACYLPARRAMRLDPMVALRYE
jgi:putative ABC transport system permease protein